MKILMLNYEFPPLGGGASPVSYNLAKELVKQGHSLDVVTMGFTGLKSFEVVDGINVYRVSCLRRKKEICHTYEMTSYALLAIPMLLRLVKKNEYDLNHTHFIFPTGLLSFIIKKLTGLKYLITAHGSDVPGHNPARFKLQYKLFLPLWKMIAKNASQITSPSSSLKSLILNNLPNSDVVVIPNGINQHRFSTQKKEKKILLVGRTYKYKGFQYFLEAIKDIDLDYEVNVLGDGPYLEDLKKLANEGRNKIHFLGWLNRNSSKSKELYEASSIAVFPSLQESFGLALLEAMSAGCAIIASNIPPFQEVCGDSGFLIDPTNIMDFRQTLLQLIDNDELIISYGQKAKERSLLFGWENIVKQFENVYKNHGK